jgi:hypothetical protein
MDPPVEVAPLAKLASTVLAPVRVIVKSMESPSSARLTLIGLSPVD